MDLPASCSLELPTTILGPAFTFDHGLPWFCNSFRDNRTVSPLPPSLNYLYHGFDLAQTSCSLALVARGQRLRLQQDDHISGPTDSRTVARRTSDLACSHSHAMNCRVPDTPSQWYTADWDYAQTTAEFFCACIGLATLIHLVSLSRARTMGRRYVFMVSRLCIFRLTFVSTIAKRPHLDSPDSSTG